MLANYRSVGILDVPSEMYVRFPAYSTVGRLSICPGQRESLGASVNNYLGVNEGCVLRFPSLFLIS